MPEFYVMIDEVNLLDYGFEPNREVFNSTPDIRSHTEIVNGRDGLFDFGSSLGQRELVFGGQFYADDLATLEANMAVVKRVLYDDGQEKKVRCSRWPNLRFWARLASPFDPKYWEPTLASSVCDVVIRMRTVTRPWGESLSVSRVANQLAPGATLQVPNGGDHPVPPIITLIVTGATNGSVTGLSVTNTNTNKTLSLSGTYNFGDSIVIDCDKHTVSKNGSNNMANQSGEFFVINRDLSVKKTDDEGTEYTDNQHTLVKVNYTPANNAWIRIEMQFRERYL